MQNATPTHLSRGFECTDCRQPITDEKRGYTIRKRGTHEPQGYLCEPCGKARLARHEAQHA